MRFFCSAYAIRKHTQMRDLRSPKPTQTHSIPLGMRVCGRGNCGIDPRLWNIGLSRSECALARARMKVQPLAKNSSQTPNPIGSKWTSSAVARTGIKLAARPRGAMPPHPRRQASRYHLCCHLKNGNVMPIPDQSSELRKSRGRVCTNRMAQSTGREEANIAGATSVRLHVARNSKLGFRATLFAWGRSQSRIYGQLRARVRAIGRAAL